MAEICPASSKGMSKQSDCEEGQSSIAGNDLSASPRRRWAHAFREIKRQNAGPKITPSKHDCLEVRQFKLFNERDPNFLESLMVHLQVEFFEEGKDLVHQGEKNEKVYFLIHGDVGVISGETMKMQLSTHRAGACFGEALAPGVTKPSPATLRALSACDCWVVHKRCFEKILAQFPKDALFFRKLAQKNENLLTRISFSFEGSFQRSFQGDDTNEDMWYAQQAAAVSKTLPAATRDDDTERASMLTERKAFQLMEQKMQVVASRLLVDHVAHAPPSLRLLEEPLLSHSLSPRRPSPRGTADTRLSFAQHDNQEHLSSRCLPLRRHSMQGTADARQSLAQPDNQGPLSSRCFRRRYSSQGTADTRQLLAQQDDQEPLSSRCLPPRHCSSKGTADTRLQLAQKSDNQEPSSWTSGPSRRSRSLAVAELPEAKQAFQLPSTMTAEQSQQLGSPTSVNNKEASTPRRSTLRGTADTRLPEARQDSRRTSGTSLRDTLKLPCVPQKSQKLVDSPTREHDVSKALLSDACSREDRVTRLVSDYQCVGLLAC
eukprot:gnl/TRDRNA2_/TRDRNA2_176626_c0_seq11.p1 gnl/TRDRNA2_/TRDRNA2_176626_c0~~gnl/TRDRNA2_/TRDRNA2_176626_c0_seq11.p1  ORF type:complete len:545 (+),score=39.29 gnl/TRDRNA2_/TRDRNA2_176626_c0_seq11:35-1669(+)